MPFQTLFSIAHENAGKSFRLLHLAKKAQGPFFVISGICSLMVFETPAYACGACTTMFADYFFPFLKFWIPVFFVWLIASGVFIHLLKRNHSDSGFIKKCDFSFPLGIAVYFVVFILSLGSPLVPFIVVFLWWVFKTASVVFAKKPDLVLLEKKWKKANMWSLILTVFLFAYFNVYQYSNPNRLVKFLEYPSGPRYIAYRHAIRVGEDMIPAIMKIYVLPEQRTEVDHRIEMNQIDGVRAIERITGKDFKGDRAAVVKWWKETGKQQYQNKK